MATTKKTKWSEILANYDALIAQIWDMAFEGLCLTARPQPQTL
jgi:hypothetical protein